FEHGQPVSLRPQYHRVRRGLGPEPRGRRRGTHVDGAVRRRNDAGGRIHRQSATGSLRRLLGFHFRHAAYGSSLPECRAHAAVRDRSAGLTGKGGTFSLDNVLFSLSPPGSFVINFDSLADATIVDSAYQAPLGVTFFNTLGGSVYARALSSAPSPPNSIAPFS